VTPDVVVAEEYAPSPQPMMVPTPEQPLMGTVVMVAEGRFMEQDTL